MLSIQVQKALKPSVEWHKLYGPYQKQARAQPRCPPAGCRVSSSSSSCSSSSSFLLSSLELTQKSMRLKYEPASKALHIHATYSRGFRSQLAGRRDACVRCERDTETGHSERERKGESERLAHLHGAGGLDLGGSVAHIPLVNILLLLSVFG